MNQKNVFVRRAVLVALGLLPFTSLPAADPFAEIVRKSDPLSPAEEQTKFHLPPGFEIQLVASEPAIAKPMNLAFDVQGRLWATTSREYPFPVTDGKPGRDEIMVFENFAANGAAGKVTSFTGGLNIPIGLLPYKNGVLAFSIPNITYFEDTDGDGRADRQEKVLGRFGFEKDTHGMTGAFRRGYDGWVYADHGFNNDSTVKAEDGSEIKLNSGNCYRFRPDGSRVEQYSWGQVNPFGLMFDDLGDLWSADCHSSPVYQLLRGAYYPSFGKPHDGLGFAPSICAHSHGSTAIAGMVFYDDDRFPAEFRRNTFIGNVMTCRINRDTHEEHGSTRIAKEAADFLSCDDPWFRPVDIQLGPDGALYIADFYNRIIGHYEVPLTHPGRDRERGRIWRVVYTGADTAKKKEKAVASNKPLKTDALIDDLASPNITRRTLALNALVDRTDPKSIRLLQKIVENKKGVANQKAAALWVLHRLGALTDPALYLAAHDADRTVRVHAMRVLADLPTLTSDQAGVVIVALSDKDAYVQRAAAEALQRHPDANNVLPLLSLRQRVAPDDSQLRHVVRMALRNQLEAEGGFLGARRVRLTETESRYLADVSLGSQTPAAGEFIITHLRRFSEQRDQLAEYLRHAARVAPEARLGELATFTQEKFPDDVDFQLALFKSVQAGLVQRGAAMPVAVEKWGAQLAEKLLGSVDPATLRWRHVPLGANPENPWQLQARPSTDGDNNSAFFSSLPSGEKLTGILRSQPFPLPAKLEFFLAGHDGQPPAAAQHKNAVRLRNAATDAVLMEQFPFRQDTARQVTWDLAAFAGQSGYLEIMDGDNGDAYAWIAVGRFEPNVVPLTVVSPRDLENRQVSGAELSESLRLFSQEKRLAEMFQSAACGQSARAAAAKAIATLNPGPYVPALAAILADPTESMKLREKIAQSLALANLAPARRALTETLVNAPQSLQTPIALALAGNAEGAEALLQTIELGEVSAHVLLENAVKDRLTAAKPRDLANRVAILTKNLTPLSAEKQKLIDARRKGFRSAKVSTVNGAKVFTQSCSVCHQLNGQGAVVGPQLDGVGNRGADRLMEDILDPNRNVDHAFRYSNLTLKDDTALTGLFRREEGATLVFVDGTGKEITLAKKDIVERRDSLNSLMPDNFGEAIPEQDFEDLIAYLVSTGSRGSK